MVQGETSEADTPTIRLGATPSGLISDPPPSSRNFYAALPVTALPIYPGLGQAPSMLDCIAGGWVELLKQWNNNSDETPRHASLLTV